MDASSTIYCVKVAKSSFEFANYLRDYHGFVFSLGDVSRLTAIQKDYAEDGKFATMLREFVVSRYTPLEAEILTNDREFDELFRIKVFNDCVKFPNKQTMHKMKLIYPDLMNELCGTDRDSYLFKSNGE